MVQPKPYLGNPVGAVSTGRAGADAAGRGLANLGRAIANVADAALSIEVAEARVREKLRQQRVQRDLLTASERLLEFRFSRAAELQQLDPTAPDYEQRVEELLTVPDDALADLDPDAAAQAALDFKRASLDLRLKAVAERDRALQERATADFEHAAEQVLGAIVADPDGFEATLGEAQPILQRLTATLPEHKARELADQFSERALFARVEGLVQQGRFGEARRFKRSILSQLDPGQATRMDQLISGAEIARRQQNLMNTAAAAADLAVRVATGEAGVAEVEEFAKSPAAQGREMWVANLLIRAREQEQRAQEQLRARSTLLEQWSSGAPLTVPTQAEADKLFEALSEANPELAAKPEFASEFVERTGFVPSTLQRTIQRLGQSDDPAEVAQAVQLHAELQRLAPGAKTGAPDLVTYVAEASRALSLPPADVAAKLLARGDRNPERDTKLADTWRQQRIKEASKAGEPPFLVDLGEGDAVPLPADLQPFFEKLHRSYTVLSGDPEQAADLALRHLSRTVGKSRVGTTSQQGYYTPFPPEHFVPEHVRVMLGLDGAAALVTEEVLSGLGFEPAEPPSWAPELPRVRLVPDDVTQAELLAGRARPSWRVDVLREGGVYTPVRSEDGGFLRWRPGTLNDYLSSEAYKRRRAAVVRRAIHDPAPENVAPVSP